MKPKDDLGELVKEWQNYNEDDEHWSHKICLTLSSCADQLEKVLKGKVVVDRQDLELLDRIREGGAWAYIKNYPFSVEKFLEKYLPKKPNGKRP